MTTPTLFDVSAYIQSNYTRPLFPSDVYTFLVMERLFREHRPRTVVDVGAGPCLMTTLAALPYCEGVTLYEPAQENIDYLNSQRRRLDETWRPFIDIFQTVTGEVFDFQAAMSKVAVLQGSLETLPAAMWDAATMHFVAEAAADNTAAFLTACRCWIRSVSQKGLLVGSFMENSKGSAVGMNDHPALSVTADDVWLAFALCQRSVEIEHLRAVKIRPGHDGVMLAIGKATP